MPYHTTGHYHSSDNSDNSSADADDGAAAANNESTASVDNSDNSVDSSAQARYGSAAANGEGSTASTDNSDNSINPDSSDNSEAGAFKDSVAANNEGTATINNSVSLGSIAVSTSLLDSTVADNSTVVEGWKSDQETTNDVSGSFGNAAGISVAAQNLGQASAVQQSVNVQANLTSGAAP
jgi:hypothetical protein